MKKLLSLLLFSFILFSCEKPLEETSEKQEDTSYSVPEVSNDGPRLFTAEDLFSTQRISSPQLSPDGEWILYRLSTPVIDDNKLYSDLFVVKSDGSETIQLTNDTYSDANATWSPDGSQIAFLSNRSGSMQIYTMNFPDGNPKQVSEIENGVSALSYSPDGKYFSFSSDVKMFKSIEDEYPEYDKANVRKYEGLPIRHWDTWEDDKVSHVFVMPVAGGDAKDLMEGEPYESPLKPFGGGEQIAWSNNSKELIYTCKKVEDYVFSTNSDLYAVDIETGETTNFTSENLGYDMDPQYSPDGKYVAYKSQETPGFEADKIRLMLHNTETGENMELLKDLDQWVTDFIWSKDGSEIYFTATDSGAYSIFKTSVPDGEFERLTKEKYNRSSLQISPDGEFLYYARESMTEPSNLYKMSVNGGEETKITKINDELFANFKKPKIEERWITSTDGAKVHTWVVYPPDFDETKQYPMISYAQGGPQSMISQRFHYRWNYMLMASNGYIVMLPNRRGLPGFGQDWNDAISLDWGGQPMKDILAATDELAKEPYVDENNMCNVGASAGGYAAFWLSGHHNGRFNAFIAHCGVFNLISMYGSTEELFFPNSEYGGPYWDPAFRQNFEKNSPHNYVENWDTPIMISTGEGDYRVPYTQSLEAYTAAKAQGIDAKLLVYPDETHFIAQPQNFLIWSNEFFSWLDKYCK